MLSSALLREGAYIVGDELVHPSTALAYTFELSVPSRESPHVVAHVRVRKRPARALDDADSAAALAGIATKVVASPLGMHATLAKRPVAGDALSASVLSRWKEAGLLPPGELDDDAVVFLKMSEGVEVPFPRACVLTEEPRREGMPMPAASPGNKTATSPQQQQAKARPETPKSAKAKAAARSRKRPRSPSTAVDTVVKTEAKPEVKPKPEPALPKHDPLVDVQERFAADAPTAKSLNDALELAKKEGKADPVPVLLHPLGDAIPPPSFESPEEKVEPAKTQEGTTSETHNSAAAVAKTAAADGEQSAVIENGNMTGEIAGEKQASAEPARPTLSKRSESSDGIDAFLLDGDTSGGQSGFDSGPTMDMTDFTAFDDDVTKFFGNGMDDRLPGTDNPLSNPDVSGRSMQQGQTTGVGRLADQDANLSQSNSDASKLMRDSQMDVDTEVQKTPGDARVIAGRDGGGMYSQDIMAMALSTLRKQGVVSSRPDGKALGSKLTGFFEDDLTERRLVRLHAAGSIGKRHTRSKLIARRLHINSKNDAYSMRRDSPSTVSDSSSFYGLSQASYKVRSDEKRQSLMDLYVPRRKMKAFLQLRKSGRPISRTSTLVHSDTEDSVSSEYEDDDVSQAKSTGVLDTTEKMNGESTSLHQSSSGLSGHLKEEGDSPASRDPNKLDFDPVKIVESVAVDCASACMVLAASRLSSLSFSPVSVEAESSPVAVEASGTSWTSREEDSSKGVGPQHTETKAAHALSVAKAHVAQGGSPINRTAIAAKRERDMLALLTILEMQAFSVQELDLFREVNISQKRETFALGTRPNASVKKECATVSSATVRRVVHGLPRILETSRVFGSCSAKLRALNKDAPSLKVEGPLAVSDVIGESASVFPLDLPRVCVGYNSNWIETPSGVLPLWEKTGLEPYSERKNVEYVAVAPKDMENDVRLFLRDLSAAYEECSFGRHSAMPFDAVTLISNSMVKTEQRGRMKNPDLLSDSDRAMAEQYHLAITGLCTKLAAVTREHRKNANGTATNIVAYIVSPFENGDMAANVALLRAVAPLVSAIPGAVPSTVTMLGSSSGGTSLPPAPWRSSPAAKSVVSITVRILPREVVDRQLSGHVQIKCLLERSLRPQLVKAVSFSVFSSIRSKRVRTAHVDGEVAGMLSRASLMPDDLMSPMTPDIVAESPGGNPPAPVSPRGANSDDNGGSPSANSMTLASAFVDQSSALSPSFLHEPAIVLSGVGKHLGQTDARPNIVLHLAYSYCESSSRYVFVWTSQRGEMMDIATVPVSKVAVGASRRKAFWCMWARGQRWKISYVEEIHATISKLGDLLEGEVEDWDWVLGKVMRSDISPGDKQAEEKPSENVVRRFPPAMEPPRGDDISDLYTDHPTPATPGTSQPATAGSSSKGTISLDTKMPTISSVTILNVCEAEENLFMEIPDAEDDADRRDFAIVSEGSPSNGRSVLASAILARFKPNDVTALQLNLVRHYGKERQGEDMTDDRSPWDASSVESIASSIAMNFHELRYVGAPPSWPQGRWLSSYPVHLDIVRRFERQVRFVHAHAFAPNMPGLK